MHGSYIYMLCVNAASSGHCLDTLHGIRKTNWGRKLSQTIDGIIIWKIIPIKGSEEVGGWLYPCWSVACGIWLQSVTVTFYYLMLQPCQAVTIKKKGGPAKSELHILQNVPVTQPLSSLVNSGFYSREMACSAWPLSLSLSTSVQAFSSGWYRVSAVSIIGEGHCLLILIAMRNLTAHADRFQHSMHHWRLAVPDRVSCLYIQYITDREWRVGTEWYRGQESGCGFEISGSTIFGRTIMPHWKRIFV